jgi:non-ribosomal peptide synthetase-like protein
MLQYGGADRLAVDTGEVQLTYDELDRKANQLARYLRARGVKSGDRIALLFDQAVHSYIGMLAVLKVNAAYVPLDVGFPADRMAYIIEDANVSLVLSLSWVREKVPGVQELGAPVVFVDQMEPLLAEQDSRRLLDIERGGTTADLAYIIYTSGSTGRPKGVAIDHPSICNFVRVAAEVYGVRPSDRMYQGLTIAFDFSVEEIWVSWASGATLVPKPPGGSLLGADLHEFLTENRVTAMCVVPTLLATIEDDLPLMRFLLVSGEACPQDLIARWWSPKRRFLNVYGPTEATVTATWTELRPDKPVTIGVPLPTYSTVILDVDNPYRALPHGATGEIGIAGVGLALGYLNNPEKTGKAFIDDFLNIPANPSKRIYRTGDLGRVNEDREIEYLGRIDLQVKIRGYRIELTEIESVLLQVPGIAAAVVNTYEPTPGNVELVGYYSLRADTASVDQEEIFALLRERLPKYMVPAYLEELTAIPMTTSDKADRKALPPPGQRATRGRRSSGADQPVDRPVVAAANQTERIMASALATVLGVPEVSVDTDFFDELGANSLLLTQFSAKLRKEHNLPRISIKEMYQNPTVRQLAKLIGGAAATSSNGSSGPKTAVPPPAPGSNVRYFLTGVGQLLVFLAVVLLLGWLFDIGYVWVETAADLLHTYLRATAFIVLTFAGLVLLPILMKYVLVDQWKPSEIRLWSLRYLRFWLAETLIQVNPMALFVGSPLYLMYLRALGAKIGRNVVIRTPFMPVVTDLITIGDNTVIGKTTIFRGYHAEGKVLRLGPVTIGSNVMIGEGTVLDINTSIGDGAQLGNASTLLPGQSIPAGEVWAGTPAVPYPGADYRTVQPLPASKVRKFFYGIYQLLGIVIVAPVAFTIFVELFNRIPILFQFQHDNGALLRNPWFDLAVLVGSLIVFFALVGGGVLVLTTVPKLLNRLITPGRTYPLYGLHYIAQTTITTLTNSAYYNKLFGDASFITTYLTKLGWDLGEIKQTGSNFGTELLQDSPFYSKVGTDTLISDGLSMMNAEFSPTSFRVVDVVVGESAFLGNDIAFPADAKVGNNILLGTKVMVPVTGPVRENIGLLGSPPFEIPRKIAREKEIDYLNDPAEVARRLAAKTRYNFRTILVTLMLQWFGFAVAVSFGLTALSLLDSFGGFAVACAEVIVAVFALLYPALQEQTVLRFRPLTPQSCSIYDPYFWGHERLWKVYATPMLFGTPFQNMILRLAGVRLGRRVFNDGCAIVEKSLTTVGDDATLNFRSVIQCHSLEDGFFKSDYSTLGPGVTIGINSYVHYGVTMGHSAILEANAFLLKGEETEPGSRYSGNPATEVRGIVAPAAVGGAAVVPVAIAQVQPR